MDALMPFCRFNPRYLANESSRVAFALLCFIYLLLEGRCLVIELGSSARFLDEWMDGWMSEGRGRRASSSDARAGEGSGLGEDDDAAFAGDVAFHQILPPAPPSNECQKGWVRQEGEGERERAIGFD